MIVYMRFFHSVHSNYWRSPLLADAGVHMPNEDSVYAHTNDDAMVFGDILLTCTNSCWTHCLLEWSLHYTYAYEMCPQCTHNGSDDRWFANIEQCRMCLPTERARTQPVAGCLWSGGSAKDCVLRTQCKHTHALEPLCLLDGWKRPHDFLAVHQAKMYFEKIAPRMTKNNQYKVLIFNKLVFTAHMRRFNSILCIYFISSVVESGGKCCRMLSTKNRVTQMGGPNPNECKTIIRILFHHAFVHLECSIINITFIASGTIH